MKALLLFFAFAILLLSCNSGNQKKSYFQNSQTYLSPKADTTVTFKDGIPIFYNMYLSVEMSSLFKSMGVSYDEKILNSPGRINRYNTSVDKALNLGVYAVDLSYARYFDQIDLAGKYLEVMHELTTDLGIPDDEFKISLKRIENNVSNKDSLIRIANELYKKTEHHLKQNDRESTAAFIIAGGWTEALHIATDLLLKTNTKDTEMVERVEEQKFSLLDLIQLFKKYENETAVKEMLSKLYDLKSTFEKINANQNNPELFKEIAFKINSLRTDVIN